MYLVNNIRPIRGTLQQSVTHFYMHGQLEIGITFSGL